MSDYYTAYFKIRKEDKVLKLAWKEEKGQGELTRQKLGHDEKRLNSLFLYCGISISTLQTYKHGVQQAC